MIFKQVDEIIAGLKTQTRRVVKDGEGFNCFPSGWIRDVRIYPNIPLPHSMIGTIKWQVGRTYAVVPKRGAPTFIHDGKPLRIRITTIRHERLQDITEADAQAEGVLNVAEYRRLWESINKAKGTRWEDNPLVWVLTFEVAPEAAHD